MPNKAHAVTAMLGCPKTVKDRVPSHVASTEIMPALAMSTARLAWNILMCSHWLFNIAEERRTRQRRKKLALLTGSGRGGGHNRTAEQWLPYIRLAPLPELADSSNIEGPPRISVIQ